MGYDKRHLEEWHEGTWSIVFWQKVVECHVCHVIFVIVIKMEKLVDLLLNYVKQYPRVYVHSRAYFLSFQEKHAKTKVKRKRQMWQVVWESFFFQNEATFPLVWESYTHVCKCMIVRENADTDMIVCVNTKHIHEHRHSVNKMDCLG